MVTYYHFFLLDSEEIVYIYDDFYFNRDGQYLLSCSCHLAKLK